MEEDGKKWQMCKTYAEFIFFFSFCNAGKEVGGFLLLETQIHRVALGCSHALLWRSSTIIKLSLLFAKELL